MEREAFSRRDLLFLYAPLLEADKNQRNRQEMEITTKATLKTSAIPMKDSPATLVVDIDNSSLLHMLKGSPNAPAVAQKMITCLQKLFTRLKSTVLARENTILNLNLSRLEYPIHFWEEALYVAAQRADFPHTVYITEQGTANRLQYIEKNRTLHKFVSHLAAREPTVDEETATSGDYEDLLKRTIMIITRQYGFDEQAIELPLAKTHNLEELIHYCKTYRP